MKQLYSCAYPYTTSNERYETDNIIITSDHYKTGYANTGGNVIDIIFNNRAGICNGYNNTINIVHEFKNNIKVAPKHFVVNTHMLDNRYSVTITLYYYDAETKQWIQYYTGSSKCTGGSHAYAYDIQSDITTEILTSKLKAVIVGNHYCWVDHVDYQFTIDKTSAMVKNKVEHVIMQNELFQKVTSSAEILSD